MQSNQLEQLDDDKRCSFDKEDGTQCGGFHVKESPYCSFHSGKLKEATARKQAQVLKQQELQEDFDFSYFSTKSRQDVQLLTEKVINGVIKGSLKKDKAALLSTFLPFAYKIAKELENTGARSGSISVKITESKSLTLSMDEEMMDRYLSANEAVKVEMLEDMQMSGKLQMTKGDGGQVIDVQATVDADKVKVPAAGLAAISEHTDLPLTPKQVTKLFGRNLGEAETLKPEKKGPDMIGFGHVFEIGGRPEHSDPVKHKWKGKYEAELKTGLAKLWFTCEHCGRREPNVVEEICPKAN
jgi:hypothetical protein